MWARLGLALVVCNAGPALAADESLLEESDFYYQCAAFYQGALDSKLQPKDRPTARIEADIAKAIRAAVGLGITAREGPRRMTFAEIDAMERRVAVKASSFEAQFREDPAYGRTWIVDGFGHCDKKMGQLRAGQ